MSIDGLHRLVIVGGGVAGLELASALGRRARADSNRDERMTVTLVDRDSAHVWKPMLHTIAAGTQDLSQQQTPYLAQARAAGFTYEPGQFCGLDRQRRSITLGPLLDAAGETIVPERSLEYDTLVLAVGSRSNTFRTPGVADHCLMIDSRLQAEAFNVALRLQLVRAIATDAALSIAIVGGGATGVELSAEIMRLAETVRAYGDDDASHRLAVTLVEAGPRLLSGFPEDISAAARERLESLGVQVLLNSTVRKASATYLDFGGGHVLRATLKVWAAGIKGPDELASLTDLDVSANNQVVVTASLQSSRDSNVFALGDCSTLAADAGHRHPATAQVAHQQARHLIRHLPAYVHGGVAIPPFRYRHFGSVVALGDYDAFASLGRSGFFEGLTVRGRLAQLSHSLLYRSHQSRIHGFWRGGLLWLIDRLNRRVRAPIRLD
jgi:NADH:quinone reductase (non-electrogenic)